MLYRIIMEELSSEHLQKQRQILENERNWDNKFQAVTENAILNIEKIMKEKWIPVILDAK